MSGSAGGGGYEYQATVAAYVYVHILAERQLSWLPEVGAPDIPQAVLAESGGAGDDLRIVLRNGSIIEVQAKHGLHKGRDYWNALLSLARGLAADPALYGILVVDSTASGTIRDDLRRGLIRLASRAAGTPNATTQQVVARFAAEHIHHPTLFERLSVVVVDSENGLPGMQLACEVLTRVVAEPDQSLTAWEILVRDGLRLIGIRGERRAASLVRMLQSHQAISLSPTSTNAAVVAARYASWLSNLYSTFTIPGLGLTLPMETAWIDLDLAKAETLRADDLPPNVEEQLLAYHDRARFSHRRADGSTFKSRFIRRLPNRIVLIGGPGSGKSTLLRHIAHELSSSGACIQYVRLRQVLQVFDDLGTFDDALLTVATDNSGINLTEARRALGAPEYLLADGLDECERRDFVVEQLKAWAEGHSSTRILVATRSFGYTPAQFPNWAQIELLPIQLDNEGLRAHARRLMSARGLEASRIEEMIGALERHLNEYGAVSVAARNPLLFGFLVGLSIQNVPLGRTRAELYKRVVQYAYQRAERDRDTSISIDESIADFVVNAAAWRLMHEPQLSKSSLLDNLRDELAPAMGIAPLSARAESGKSLRFWENKGIIETLWWAGDELVTFVHPTFGEYCAARYVAETLRDEPFRAWLRQVRRDQRWRQTILLAAGANAEVKIVTALLSLDGEGGGQSSATEAVLAAAALTEVVAPPPDLVEVVITRLRQRLVSPIPAVAFEAATAILGLAGYASPLVAHLALPLMTHDQRWTRLAAARLTLAVGGDGIDVETLASIVADILDHPDRGTSALDLSHHRRWPGGGAWEFQNAVLVDGLQVLILRRPGPATDALLERAVESDAKSARTQIALFALLQSHGFNALADRLQSQWRLTDPIRVFSRGDYNSLESAILQAVAHSVAPTQRPSSVQGMQDLETLATLLGFLGWLTDVDGGWLANIDYVDQEATDAVNRGAIAALRLDRERLSEEVGWALANLTDLQRDRGLLASLEAPPVTPQWQLAAALSLPCEVLARGLMHPSQAISRTAALLLYQHANEPQTDIVLRHVLDEGGYQALARVAELAPHIWKENARDIIIARLNGRLTSGCVYLVETLTSLTPPEGDVGTFRVLMRALNSQDPRLATAAADGLSTLDVTGLTGMLSEIENSLRDWTTRGTRCPIHDVTVHGDTHEGCMFVASTPRAAIVRLLARMGQLDSEGLAALCQDQRRDVREAAAQALAESAQDDAEEAVSLLTRVEADALPIEVLTMVLASPATSLGAVRDTLMRLFYAPNVTVRRRMVEALSEATWLNNDEKLALAAATEHDEDAEVRDYAAGALRAVQSSAS